jgi:hypothetical protein
MFLTDADMNGLRQGDILANLPFPLVRSVDLRFLGSLHGDAPIFRPTQTKHRDDPEWLTCQLLVRMGFGALLSQCCNVELQPSGKPRTPSFAIARLIPIPAHFLGSIEKLESLRANKDPRNPNPHEQGYINLFHITLHERLQNREWVVDFNQVFSLPAEDYQEILRRKVLQMTDDARIRFKVKLAAALSRMTEDELDLNHPWLRPAAIGPEPPASEAVPATEPAALEGGPAVPRAEPAVPGAQPPTAV